jgi:hypothetical protein
MKQMGARNAGNPHVACDVEGAGDVERSRIPRPTGAPVLDPTCERLAVRLRRATHRNIYVRSHRAGERVMTSVSRFLTSKLRLEVNETKSAVARPEERKFLGLSISNDGS